MSLLDAFLLDPAPFNVWIAYRMDGAKGSGTANDPYDGSTAAKFDARMSELPEKTTVHLGPATAANPFLTTGFWINSDGSSGSGWQPKAGMRLVGSGIDVTTLKLTGASDPASGTRHYFAIGHTLSSTTLDSFEVSDLTIDCNLPTSGTFVSVGAVRLMGNHARIRRVKAIHWGTASIRPGRVFSIITADWSAGLVEVAGCGMEDCIAIQPAISCAESAVTVLHVGGRQEVPAWAEGYGKGVFIRNCFVDGGLIDPGPPEDYSLIGFSMNGCRAGVVEGNQFHHPHHGGPAGNLGSAMEVIVRNNLFKNMRRGPCWALGSLLDPPQVDSSSLSLTSLLRDLDHDGSGKTALATTNADHDLQPGERVKMDASGGPVQFRGIFVIREVPASDQFRYQMSSDPGGATPTNPTLQKVFGATRLVIERNTIELVPSADGLAGIELTDLGGSVSLAPDYGYGDVIIRDNLIRYVDGAFGAGYAGSGIKVAGAKLATVRNNLLECVPISPIEIQRCGAVSWFDNRTLNAALIARVDELTGKPVEEYDAAAEDALVAALAGGT
jgi:hypothetical protein